MRGMELLALVRQRAHFAAIYLVCDRYTPQEERAARAAGATAFFCKPPSLAWLHESFYEERAGPAWVPLKRDENRGGYSERRWYHATLLYSEVMSICLLHGCGRSRVVGHRTR